MVKVQSLSLTVEYTRFQCLLEGRNVILTCEIFGFPRPEIVFKRDDINIIPGMAGFERITNISLDQVCAVVLVQFLVDFFKPNSIIGVWCSSLSVEGRGGR